MRESNFSRARAGLACVAMLGAASSMAQAPAPDGRVFAEAARRALDANPGLPYSPTTILVRFRPEATPAQRAQARAMLGGALVQRHDLVPGLETVGTRLDPALAVQLLSARPGVEYAELDYTVRADVIPNDPSFGTLWGMHNTGQSGGTVDADIDAPEAWNTYTGDPNILVAIIDTGIQLSHPDLAANVWVNTAEVAGNGIDDDGNGYIDDRNGWNFYSNNNNPNDDNGHGSHTGGTVGAVGNNAVGVVGVNWRCKLMALKFLGAGGSGSTSGAIAALNYAVAKGCKVSNNSWGGGGYSTSLYNAINNARTQNHVFCAAAGNSNVNTDTSPHYPSSYNLDNIISVASTNRVDAKSSFSNYGATTVDLGAPGESILSTVPTNSYGTASGTSMACPHVAGVAALVKGRNPSFTSSQVRTSILSTVRPVSSMAGRTVTGGVLNAAGAIAWSPNQPPVVTITSPANNSTFEIGSTVTFAGTANDPEQGNLGANLIWTSSLQGQIGTGVTFATGSLVLGAHTITARVTDAGGQTGQASITVNIVNPPPPAAPTNWTVRQEAPVRARMTWTDNSNNEAGFRIERQRNIGIFSWGETTTFTVPANTTTTTNTVALKGVYRYRIQAYNAGGNSAWTAYVNVKL